MSVSVYPLKLGEVENWVSHAEEVQDQRVLVAGTGAGKQVFDLVSKGADVTAVDQSTPAIEFQREAFDRLDLEKPELINAELQNVELPADEFDYISCMGVLHHMVDPEPALELFSRTCKPDGSIDIMVFNERSPRLWEMRLLYHLTNVVPIGDWLSRDTKARFNWWDNYENPIQTGYSEAEFERLLERNGLEMTSLEYGGPLFDKLGLYAILPPIVSFALRSKFEHWRN